MHAWSSLVVTSIWLFSLTRSDVNDINYYHCHTEASGPVPDQCDLLNQRWFSHSQSQQQLRPEAAPESRYLETKEKNSRPAPQHNTQLCWDQADPAGCALCTARCYMQLLFSLLWQLYCSLRCTVNNIGAAPLYIIYLIHVLSSNPTYWYFYHALYHMIATCFGCIHYKYFSI